MLEVPYGWLVRSMHVWGANLFIAVAGLHFLSVLFTRAYRRPRELTWVSGMAMLLLALGFGFSGYLLPWNELAYYATLVGTKIPAVLPGIGDLVVHLLRGGEQVTGDTITRFFAAHVMILPVCFGLLLLGHLILIQVQGMSLPLGLAQHQVKDHRPFFSEFLLVDACVWLLLLGLIVTLSLFLPAEMGIKADPLEAGSGGDQAGMVFPLHVPDPQASARGVGRCPFGAGGGISAVVAVCGSQRSAGETGSARHGPVLRHAGLCPDLRTVGLARSRRASRDANRSRPKPTAFPGAACRCCCSGA